MIQPGSEAMVTVSGVAVARVFGMVSGYCMAALCVRKNHGILRHIILGVTSKDGSAYRSRRFAKALRMLAIRHIFTRPCTPKTNGKAERFIQTLLSEWAYGLA